MMFASLSPRARWGIHAVWATSALMVGALMLHLALGWFPGWHDFLGVAITFLPAVLCLACAWLIPYNRLPALLLGIGMASWTVASVYLSYWIDQDVPASFPSLSDGLWAAYYLCALFAVVRLMRNRVNIPNRGVWVDALIAALALAAVTSAVLVDPILDATDGGLAAIVTNLVYPLWDVLILGVILWVFALCAWRPGRPWAILGLVFAGHFCADALYTYQVVTDTYSANTLLDASWGVLMLGMAYAVFQPQPQGHDVRFEGWAPMMAPIATALVAVALTAYGLFFPLNTTAAVLTVATLVVSFIRAIGAFADVRTLSRNEALRLARHALILDSAGEGILGVDPDGRTVFANAAALRLTGQSAEALIGDACPVVTGDATFTRVDGTSFPIESTMTPIVEEGRVTGGVVVFRDVTERREIDRMKDEFTSIVSHELRTPLTSIRGSLGLLAGGVLGPIGDQAQHMVELAVDNTERLVRLINDMLDIERIESGKVRMDFEPCDAAVLVAKAAETIGTSADSAGIRIEVVTVEAPLDADCDRIQRTIENLLSNAVKFSPRGSTVTITCAARDDTVRIDVADQGRGIPADGLERVFERFEQVDASDARDKGGTGLGLAICASIVAQHGGRIWAESPAGAGATFSFVLPARQSDAEAAPPAGPATHSGREPLVLVCDNDADVLDVISTMVEHHGYRVARAGSGPEALAAAEREVPDVMLLDLHMPGMDGWEIARRLRDAPETRGVPVVILSVLAQADADPIGDNLEAWLEKPTHEQLLLATLARAVARGDAPARVLIVEDDEDLAKVLRTGFAAHGVATAHAASGTAAIDLAGSLQPDLVLLDLGLPDADGVAVVDWLRDHERVVSPTLVVYTAQDLDESERSRLRLDSDTEFLTKGRVTPEAVERRVLDLLALMTYEHDLTPLVLA
jgi:signal transduction histidine kinase/CheY-like chemotaxis protein